jgi:hypothetical protein
MADANDNSTILKSPLITATGIKELFWDVESVVTEDCGVPTPLANGTGVVTPRVGSATISLAIGTNNAVTSVDLIINNSAVTQAVPTSFGSGNPQTSNVAMVAWLNNLTNSSIFSVRVGNAVAMSISSNNTDGFNTSGTYIRGANIVNYTTGFASFQSGLGSNYTINSSGCGVNPIRFNKEFPSGYVGTKITAANIAGLFTFTYNNIVINGLNMDGTHPNANLQLNIADATNRPNHNPTAQCCN